MNPLFATVVRGLRARALLSAGSVLLTALAIGSAVLGPVFQQAVTNSYLVSRLNDAPNELTGLTWRFQPAGSTTDVADRRRTRRAGRHPADRRPVPAAPVGRRERPDARARRRPGAGARPRTAPAPTSTSRGAARPSRARS